MSAVEMLARARCERHWHAPCDMSGCAEFGCEWRKAAEADLAALSAAGYAVVPVGSTCPFDRIDHGGLEPEDPCPVCGDLGTFGPDGEDPPSRCISGKRPPPPRPPGRPRHDAQ